MTLPDEPARDAWLSQALRHAPDADAAPPVELSEAILRQARNAVKTPHAAAPARIDPLLQLWSWLARPPVAAGFATLMVATLVGVMWWDQPLDASLPHAETPVAMAPDPIAQAASAALPTPALATARDEAKSVTRAEPRTARGATPAPLPAAKRERAVAERAPAGATGAVGESAAETRASMAAPEPAPGAAPAPALATDAIAKPAAPARDESAERLRAPATAPAQSLAKAATVAGPALRRQDADTPIPAIDQPERWTWQRGAGVQPMTSALQRWLAQLDRVARWRSASGAAPVAADGNVLQLWRDGTLRATITLVDDAVWLTPASGTPLTAALSPAAVASLKAALLEATP